MNLCKISNNFRLQFFTSDGLRRNYLHLLLICCFWTVAQWLSFQAFADWRLWSWQIMSSSEVCGKLKPHSFLFLVSPSVNNSFIERNCFLHVFLPIEVKGDSPKIYTTFFFFLCLAPGGIAVNWLVCNRWSLLVPLSNLTFNRSLLLW